MLASGDYKIQNFLHTDRFIHMKADGTVVGYEEADIVRIASLAWILYSSKPVGSAPCHGRSSGSRDSF